MPCQELGDIVLMCLIKRAGANGVFDFVEQMTAIFKEEKVDPYVITLQSTSDFLDIFPLSGSQFKAFDGSTERIIRFKGIMCAAFNRPDDFLADDIRPDIRRVWDHWLIEESSFGIRHVLFRFDEPHILAAVAACGFCDIRESERRFLCRDHRHTEQLE